MGAALASKWAHRRLVEAAPAQRRRARGGPGRPTRYFSRKTPPRLARSCPTTRGKATKQCFFSSGRRGKVTRHCFFSNRRPRHQIWLQGPGCPTRYLSRRAAADPRNEAGVISRKNLVDDSRMGHETVFFLEWEAPEQKNTSGGGPSHSQFVEENAFRLERTSSMTRGKATKHVFFFLEWGAPEQNVTLGTEPSHLLFVEESGTRHSKWARCRLAGAPRARTGSGTGPPSTRGSGPSPASAGKGRPWPSHSLFLKENAPRLARSCPTTRGQATKQCFFSSGRRGKGHETLFFLEQEAPAPNLASGTGLSHSLFVEESGPRSSKRGRCRFAGAARTRNSGIL